ncbi:ABC transporter substrate-binding protein [Blastococcus sp. TF02A-26]|uniref:ABC transporter substrate-binding protein n=1 Tax=Blastococcus sp. TF02A-26 TaxID=2250577 RepID=UPI000DEAFDFF|nr:ABC transporter substrate-binding protein [Blastococcus sp. TF02A-26]RBY86813.1 nitrate ABC transporter substrate-binding protein [Blastococcus sp. TF02A-26]
MRTRTLPTTTSLALAAVLVLSACGSEDDPEPAAATDLVSAERCQANRDAGPITYLSSFDLGGSVAILNVLAAEELGYFDDLCLDVELQPSAENNAQLLSAGTAQIAGMGSASDVMTAIANGARITGVATYGAVGQVALMTRAGEITSLDQLAGRTLGYKIVMPAQVRAMLESEGVDLGELDLVSVGFDPTILPNGDVDALTGYKDNEPGVLDRSGHDVDVWSPTDYGVEGTFSVVATNTDWAVEHPTAVEDFLRASFQAYSWIEEDEAHLDEAIGWAEDRATSGFDATNQRARWVAGAQLIEDNLLEGHGLGYQTPELWAPEAELISRYGIVDDEVDPAAALTTEYLDAIYDGDQLVWPPAAGN